MIMNAPSRIFCRLPLSAPHSNATAYPNHRPRGGLAAPRVPSPRLLVLPGHLVVSSLPLIDIRLSVFPLARYRLHICLCAPYMRPLGRAPNAGVLGRRGPALRPRWLEGPPTPSRLPCSLRSHPRTVARAPLRYGRAVFGGGLRPGAKAPGLRPPPLHCFSADAPHAPFGRFRRSRFARVFMHLVSHLKSSCGLSAIPKADFQMSLSCMHEYPRATCTPLGGRPLPGAAML